MDNKIHNQSNVKTIIDSEININGGSISLAQTLCLDSVGITLPMEELRDSENIAMECAKEGKYDIVKELGQGGMGKIFLWKDKDIQRVVATKMLLPEKQKSLPCLQRFFEEGQITGQLEHPNIVPIHEMGVDQGSLYFTMKYVKGQSLQQLITSITKDQKVRENWSLGKMLRIFQSICNAIQYAHSKNVIHRDLKPENIMIGNFGEVMVMDWGLAKVLGQGKEVIDEDSITTLRENGGFMTVTGQITGTPLYMSPEQARGEIDKVDTRSDIYALGTILYQMLTGKNSVNGNTIFEIITAVSRGKYNSIPNKGLFGTINKELCAIINKSLEADAEKRYQSVQEFAEDIQKFMDRKPVTAYSYTFWDRVNSLIELYRREIFLVVATGILFSTTFAAWNYYQDKKKNEEEMRLAERALVEDSFIKDLEIFGISSPMKKEQKAKQKYDYNEKKNISEESDAGAIPSSALNENINPRKTKPEDGGMAIELEDIKSSEENVSPNPKNLNRLKRKHNNLKQKFQEIKSTILESTKRYNKAYEKLKLYTCRQKEAEAWWVLYQAAQRVGDESYQEIAKHNIKSLLTLEDYQKYSEKGLK